MTLKGPVDGDAEGQVGPTWYAVVEAVYGFDCKCSVVMTMELLAS